MEILQNRTYLRAECVTFLKTTEQFGGLSNMAGGYPLLINNVRVLTSEALYQACRFPHKPDVQELIIGQKSPMTAKMVSKPHRKDSRPDWDAVRVRIMYWCLRVKLAQNWEKFSDLLRSTENKPIVEESRRDQFWGAKPVDSETLVGENVLGRLLMKLRDQLCDTEKNNLWIVNPPLDTNFLFMDAPIEAIESKKPVVEHVTTLSLSLDTMSDNASSLSIIECEEPVTEPIPSVELIENGNIAVQQMQLL